jgi:hypothetical protein
MKNIVLLLCLGSGLSLYGRHACDPIPEKKGLQVREGFTEFLFPNEVAPFKKNLPAISDPEVGEALKSSDTIWYDESSMVFLYQDSIESVVGARANCVGRTVGENPPVSAVGKLKNFFGPDYRFVFPFRKAAGTDNVVNERVVNFWVPPRRNGKVLPVKYWRPSTRGRWYWTFPIGTLFGEILHEKSPAGEWYPFEIRTRKRYKDGWDVNLFRPFAIAEDLASAIIKQRPDWQASVNLREVVQHLKNKNTLVPHKMESKGFAKIFPVIQGALDPLPEIKDKALVTELLTQFPFVSTEGRIWKENGSLETYAPSSLAEYSIVPKGYEMGLIPVNEVSCNRCHEHTGRRLIDFDFDIQLYGEIWGEDRIFTWHLFQPHQFIFGTFDDSDSQSRRVNSRLVQAGLVVNQKPSPSDELYKPLPPAFVPEKSLFRP